MDGERPARPQGADTMSQKNAVPGQEAEGGCGEARPQAWGCRSVVKGTEMPGTGEGQASVAEALEELRVLLGKSIVQALAREKAPRPPHSCKSGPGPGAGGPHPQES